MIEFNIFDGGKPMAATMSFDDGVIPDRRLISIFDKYGIKGTFHLNSGLFSTPNRVEAADVREIYKNHEVALHGREHLTLTELPVHNMAVEVFEDKKSLEALCKYPIIGMSYANGAYDERVLRVLSDCGVKYSRTVWDTGRFILPEEFLRWHPTCHYIKSERLADEFIRKAEPAHCFMFGDTHMNLTGTIIGILLKMCAKNYRSVIISGLPQTHRYTIMLPLSAGLLSPPITRLSITRRFAMYGFAATVSPSGFAAGRRYICDLIL